MLFFSDAGVRAVTREHRNIVGQDIELFANGVEELLVTSAGEVGPADTSGEKGVASEEIELVFEIEGN